ncbi:MAG: 1-deoxy-D-xylulose-5-phosphate reductoisomerase [Planctomycetia bacterium]|nr:1-deoxy-D-xylulose-5-phosphate reductoisomerase [Planctomycetia bacterium]MBL6914714.1 1-deoxy-D-xylulose-5-phosphate reductoisomerase [Planctomycetota bacterium]
MTMRSPSRRVAILGSTGSIGNQALKVISESKGQLVPALIAAGSRLQSLHSQYLEHSPEDVILVSPDPETPIPAEIKTGSESLLQALAEGQYDVVLNGITGFAGLTYSLKALESGCDLALANKESLVTAGSLMKETARQNDAQIIPVDSEHNAIQQCIGDHPFQSVQRILLTASGGPFRGMNRQQLEQVTVDQALAHPTWKMGPRISVDSATLFNKAFELIEAVELFGTPPGGIEVVVHPQSVMHALVEFQDGNSISHLSEPDMRVPIRNALNNGKRRSGNFSPLDLVGRGELSFETVDHETFPALRLAQTVLDCPGTTYGAVLNAADEEAVSAFLSGDVAFLQIYDLVERAIQEHSPQEASCLEIILEADLETRKRIRSWIL